jgi:hypothetical protein
MFCFRNGEAYQIERLCRIIGARVYVMNVQCQVVDRLLGLAGSLTLFLHSGRLRIYNSLRKPVAPLSWILATCQSVYQ